MLGQPVSVKPRQQRIDADVGHYLFGKGFGHTNDRRCR